jgi:hypothetical protein
VDDDLRIDFSLRGRSGVIAVSVTPNSDPDAIGYALLTGGLPTDAARGFPVCRATVAYPAQGYAAVFGWTQLVCSTDSDPDRFELDPIALYSEVATPYAWFGVKPELFDAPSRELRYDLCWEAHSFLCVSPDAVLTRQVQAIAGFSWGFTVADGDIRIHQSAVLEHGAWDSHLGLLRTAYPEWIFDAGYAAD